MNIVETEGLSKIHESRVGLDQVILTLAESQVCGILGRNGVGEAATTRILLELLGPACGKRVILEAPGLL